MLEGGGVSRFQGYLGPAAAGMIVTLLVDGRQWAARLGARTMRWRVPARCHAAALRPAVVAPARGVFAAAGTPFSFHEIARLVLLESSIV